jgi:hypothetical protein
MALAIKSSDIDVKMLNMEAFQLLRTKFPEESDADIAR